MRIGIDARFYGPQDKGLGRYSQKLIENLEKIDGESDRQYFIFLRKRGFEEYQPQKSNFKKVLADYPWYSWSEQLFFPRLLNRYRLDLTHFCHFNVPIFYRKKMVVTIHDLILFHYPTLKNTTLNRFFYFLKLAAYFLVINQAVRKAQTIIAVSDFTKEDVTKNFKSTGKKIIVAKEGCDPPLIGDFNNLEKYAIVKPYILYIGNAYPHKNLEVLCQAFQKIRLKFPDLKLVLAGGKDFFFQRLEKRAQKLNWRGIVFPGFIEEKDLGRVYQGAEVFVMPSLYEGVGLPPLEALACGTAVASSERTSLPEFLGEAAIYFDPQKQKDMEEKIINLLVDRVWRERLVGEGRKRLNLFSWEKMTREILEVYKKNKNNN